MIKKIKLGLYMLMVFSQAWAQVKIGLWEPSYNGRTEKSVFFVGDSLTSNFKQTGDEHGMAVGFVLNNNLKADNLLYHAGFVPLTQHLQQTGVLRMTNDERKKNLPLEYGYYHRFAIQTVAWFKLQGVRVVNMSFGTSATIFADNNQNLGNTDGERLAAAKIWMQHFKASFETAFRQAPNILFVVAAGNDEENMEKSFDVPGSANLPNVLCIGALSKDGKRKISNYGKRVDIYVPAEDVAWTDDKGMEHTGTGTSLAVPQITAKAVDYISSHPSITASQLKAFLKSGH